MRSDRRSQLVLVFLLSFFAFTIVLGAQNGDNTEVKGVKEVAQYTDSDIASGVREITDSNQEYVGSVILNDDLGVLVASSKYKVGEVVRVEFAGDYTDLIIEKEIESEIEEVVLEVSKEIFSKIGGEPDLATSITAKIYQND